MRILIVASIDPTRHTGGAERVAALLAEGFSQEHEVTVFSLANPDGGTDGAAPWEQVHLPLEVPYHPGEPEDRSAREQAIWHLKELHNRASTDAFRRALEQAGPFDVASVHNIQGLSFGVFDALDEAGIPIVYTTHDFKLASPVLNRQPDRKARALSPLWPLYRAWVRRRTRPVDRFVAPSRYLSHELAEDGVLDLDKLEVVPNGVPVDIEHTLEDPDPRLLVYGVLSPHKGIQEFAEAFQAADTDLDLHIAGTGQLQDTIQALAEQDPRITYLGYVEDRELRTEVANALAVVVPSLWPENCPMVALESLAAGTPVVHTARGGLSEICPPDELGLSLPRDPSAWSGFIESLDPERLARMRPRCRKVAEQRYSLESMVADYEQTFEDVLREP